MNALKTGTIYQKINESQYLYEAYSLKERKLAQNSQILMKLIDRIVIPFYVNDYDLIVICSHYFKQFWRKGRKITFRVECLNNEIKSAEQKNDINVPNDHTRILKHFSTNFYYNWHESDDIYYVYKPFLEKYLKNLSQDEIDVFLSKIWDWEDSILSLLVDFLLGYRRVNFEKREYIYAKAFSIIRDEEASGNLIENLWITEELAKKWRVELLINIKEKAQLHIDSKVWLYNIKAAELIKDIDAEFQRRKT